MNDAELGKLTVKELRDLRDRVDNAIRASIARSRHSAQNPASASGAPTTMDLERERDAWKSWRG